jgi:hypothetical protein
VIAVCAFDLLGRAKHKPKEPDFMKKYLVAAALIVGFATPALALETFYIMFDNTLNNCSIMDKQPAGGNYKMMGQYKSKAEAEADMKTMTECG